jgi:hypothetical protein
MRFAPLQRLPARSSSMMVGLATPGRLRPQVFSTSRRVSYPPRACRPCFMPDPLMGLRPSELCSRRVAVRRLRRRSPPGVGPTRFHLDVPLPLTPVKAETSPDPNNRRPFYQDRSPGRPKRLLPTSPAPKHRRAERSPDPREPKPRRAGQLLNSPGPRSLRAGRSSAPPAPKRSRTVRPPDPPKPSAEADRPVGRDALPSARRSEDRRPSGIDPRPVDPKAPAVRTVRSPVRDPRASSGSSDPTRTPPRPKPYRECEGSSPMRSEPKLSARRTNRPRRRCPKAPVLRSAPPSALRPEGRTVSGVRSDSPHRKPK